MFEGEAATCIARGKMARGEKEGERRKKKKGKKKGGHKLRSTSSSLSIYFNGGVFERVRVSGEAAPR